jgi:hypothetical protein
MYFIPGIIAQVRHVPNARSVWIINIFLGWTFVSWIVALAMAARSQLPAQQVIIQQGWQPGGPGVAGQPTSSLHRASSRPARPAATVGTDTAAAAAAAAMGSGARPAAVAAEL